MTTAQRQCVDSTSPTFVRILLYSYTRFACTMWTLRSPHNVELKTPEAKFCLDFDLVGAPVYIPATSFVRINVYACVRGKHVSTSPENHNGAFTFSFGEHFLANVFVSRLLHAM